MRRFVSGLTVALVVAGFWTVVGPDGLVYAQGDCVSEGAVAQGETGLAADCEPRGLFSEIKGVPPTIAGVDALDSRLVEIDFAQLADVVESPMYPATGLPTLVLNLFDDVVFTGVVEHVEPTSSGHSLWGSLNGVEMGTMTLVVNGSVVAGTVRTPDGVFTIRTVGQGEYVVRQIDESSLPPPAEPTRGPLSERGNSPPSSPQERSTTGRGPLDDGSEIEVMVLYTPGARHIEGGRAAIEALIDLFVAGTNQAFANSGVTNRIRLVLTDEVEYVEDGVSDLDRLADDSDGYMDHVHNLRDMYAADLVHILVDKGSYYCGIAQLHTEELSELEEPYGFALTVVTCGEVTFAHELGHNMGLGHDRYVEPGAGSAYNFGYVNQRAFETGAPASSWWRTIMAYGNQCEEVGDFECQHIPYFSNPELTYNGDPLGVPVDSPSVGLDGPADAVRALNDRREITANFRRSSNSPTPRAGLSMSQYWLEENGGTAEVRATLHRPSSADTVVTVSAAPSDAVTLGTNRTLTIPAGKLVSVDSVTVSGVDNASQTGDVIATVSATASNADSLGVIDPEPISLSIPDDETIPVVSLSLLPDEIPEEEADGDTGQTYVTATMSSRSSEATVVTVSVESTEAEIHDDATLTIPAGQTVSIGRGVEVHAVDDSALTEARKSVTVSATASNPQGVTGPRNVTLTIIDDEAPYFEHDSISHTFTAGVAGGRFLPEAAHGDGILTYSISPEPTGGMTFSPGPPALIRVPASSVAASETAYTLTATDADGDTDSMTISITVRDGVCPDSAAVARYSGSGVVADCEALLASRDVLDGDQLLNWSENLSIKDWEGVELTSSGRVEGLSVDGMESTGTIPSELGGLTELRYLNLSTNILTGGIPSELGNLSNLESLYLYGNRLSGGIPSELADLSKLDSLNLGRNQLSGRILGELGSLSNLESLYLHGNRLTGTIPSELGGLSNLQILELQDNRLTGTIPGELGRLANLEFIYLSGNDLVGCVPNRLRDIENNDFVILGLPFCGEHACVTGRAVADATNTQLVSDCETLLAARDTLAGSATLNWSASTSITAWDGVMLGETTQGVTGLDVGGLRLTGEIPVGLGSLVNLRRLNLRDNQLTGKIPVTLGRLSNLEQLDLRDNQLTGRIPGELGRLSGLESVYLSGNDLAGCIPDGLQDVAESDLESLGLSFCGEHPCVTGRAVADATNIRLVSDCETLLAARDTLSGSAHLNWSASTSMAVWDGVRLGEAPQGVTGLNVEGLGLTGEIPMEIGGLTDLEYLHLSENQLTGNIPAELGSLSNLTELYAYRNQLSGEIPIQLASLSNLGWLNLGINRLNGEIPTQLASLSNLRWLSLTQNELTGTIPTQLGDLYNLDALDLGGNRLSGSIPAELGNLSNLTALELWGNQLSGSIPAELGNLSNLNTLFLGNNQLTGCIPAELQDMEFNDFDEVGLPFCEPQSSGAPSVGMVATTTAMVRINSPILVWAAFSEPVNGFTVDDITVANGDVSNFIGDDGDSVFIFDVTPNAIGVVTVDIAAGVATDIDGEANTAAVQLTLGLPYDDDRDGRIQIAEAIAAVSDYFSGNLSIEHAIAIVSLYFVSL